MSGGEVFCLEMALTMRFTLEAAAGLTRNMVSSTGSDRSLKRRQLKQSVSDPGRIELVQPGLNFTETGSR